MVSDHWKPWLRRIYRQDLRPFLHTVIGFAGTQSPSPCALSCTEHVEWLLQKQITHGHLPLPQLGGNKNWGKRPIPISQASPKILAHSLSEEATRRRTTWPQSIHFSGSQMAQRDAQLVTANSLLSKSEVNLPRTAKDRFVLATSHQHPGRRMQAARTPVLQSLQQDLYKLKISSSFS